jgi:hypothetical protein
MLPGFAFDAGGCMATERIRDHGDIDARRDEDEDDPD